MFVFDADTQTVTYEGTMSVPMQPEDAAAWAAVQQARWLSQIAEKLGDIQSTLASIDNTIAGK